jgi:hypothetical protein
MPIRDCGRKSLRTEDSWSVLYKYEGTNISKRESEIEIILRMK